jgi:lipopolysaccharide transport system permease protein
MVVFYIVFGIIFQRGGEGYVAFLLVGLVVWRWFDNTVRLGSNTLIANIGLMQQVYLPKIVFPSVTIMTNSVKFLITFTVLVIFLLFYGIKPTNTWLILPLIMALQVMLIAAVTWFTSVVVPFIPDFRIIIDSGLTLMFFMSGIFFDIESLPSTLAGYLRLNPMAVLIESYRSVLIEGIFPEWHNLSLLGLICLVALLISFNLHMRFNYVFPKLGTR